MAGGRALGSLVQEDSMMVKTRPAPVPLDTAALTDKLGHVFKNTELLQAALTHPSVAGSRQHKKDEASPYERLEFLGDRVLGLVIAEWLYTEFPDAREGELAKRHAALVNRDACRVIALEIGLGDYLRLAHGEDAVSSPHKNLVTLSDALEALIGALYLDAGLKAAEKFIRHYWRQMAMETKATPVDAKSTLQEWAQGHGLPLPAYKVLANSGPAHAPHFIVEVTVKGKAAVTAEGSSKRAAEKAAAELLIKQLAE
jgi:ribonuclease-3